jgi:cystathionine beta-lyase/cystathionine gamma-synthase
VRFGAFTLEGALGAADAIQTMLLQSSPGLVRLSIGIENVADLKADLEIGLAEAAKVSS